MSLIERIRKGIFLMDGAMGTQIQSRVIPQSAWEGKEGCNELLNVTAPDIIRSIHQGYFEAGSDAVETNTFGASALTLGEYDIGHRAVEINKAAARAAREAADALSTPDWPRFVFGSIGPGTKLATLGQVTFDALYDSYQKQIEGLLEGGADGLIIETCQDLLQIKAALAAADAVAGTKRKVPIYVSVTVETTGTLLIGSSIQAVVATLGSYPIDILGLNCATGPEAMHGHLDYLAKNWPGFLACMPNAGLPIVTPEGARYPLQPDQFAEILGRMARELSLNVIGGCCGTTPEHIRKLRQTVAAAVPCRASTPQQSEAATNRNVQLPQQVSSIFAPVDLTQKPPPLYIGERANATGSKKFKEALLADDYETAFNMMTEQEDQGSHVVDLSCAYAGRDEVKDVQILVARAARECKLPFVIDSTEAPVIEEALKLYGGRMIINSINFEDGGKRAHKVGAMAKKYGAALICLTIDEVGMAMNADHKVKVAHRLVEFCGKEYGLKPGDLFIDPLTFTVGSGDPSLRTAAIETIESIRRIKAEIPGVRTLLGLSNISFGLKPAGRKVLNSVFLDRCLKAGLDSCIINVIHIVPLNQIPDESKKVAEALLDNDHTNGDPLENFINYFEKLSGVVVVEETVAKPPEEAVADAVVKGKVPPLATVIPELLKKYSAEDILNNMLIPAMQEVGRLFNDGILQLPFVLKSAEVMKKAVDMIKPYMKRDESAKERGTMVIATVFGDVHDIGKNLVDIILSNNGFKVVNLGTKVPIEKMMEAVREHKADVLGMSGLLVKSALIMAENMKVLESSDVRVPIFLGGAALTPEFVDKACAPHYSQSVVYCADAFAGLANMREFMDTGKIEKKVIVSEEAPPEFEAPPMEINLSAPAPKPPFWGHRILHEINLDEVYPLLNETALIRGRWGYRRGKLSADEYKCMMNEDVYPQLARLKKECKENGIFKAQAAYGYFKCRGEGETLYVYPDADKKSEPIKMVFPRQTKSPFISIPDFYRRDEDVAGFMVVTLGKNIEIESARLMKEDRYQDYLILHGFAVEVTDALAEWCHSLMRAELGYADPTGLTVQDFIIQKYQGSRYGFGYPACPDLSMNKICSDLVHDSEIGVSLSENFMMIPEFTTSALVAVHPKAKYFYV